MRYADYGLSVLSECLIFDEFGMTLAFVDDIVFFFSGKIIENKYLRELKVLVAVWKWPLQKKILSVNERRFGY